MLTSMHEVVLLRYFIYQGLSPPRPSHKGTRFVEVGGTPTRRCYKKQAGETGAARLGAGPGQGSDQSFDSNTAMRKEETGQR